MFTNFANIFSNLNSFVLKMLILDPSNWNLPKLAYRLFLLKLRQLEKNPPIGFFPTGGFEGLSYPS